MDITISNSTTNLPTQTPPNMERIIRLTASKLFPVGLGHELPLVGAPTPEQRDGLARRAARIRQWLAPSQNDPAIKAELAALLGTRPPMGGANDVGDAEITLEIYLADLRDLPFFAISAACKDIRQGRAGPRAYRPTQAEIREVAERHMYPIAKELRTIETILSAKVVDMEENAERRAEVVKAIRDGVQSIRDAGKKAEEQRDQRIRKEAEYRVVETAAEIEARLKSPMPKLSPEILKQFGVTEKREAAE